AGKDERFLRLARRVDGIDDLLQPHSQRLRSRHLRVVARRLVGATVKKVELEVGEAVFAQPSKQVTQKALDIRMGRVEDVICAAETGIDQWRAVARLEEPVRMRRGQLRVTGYVKGREPDADLQPVAMHPGRQRVQPSGEELVR